MHTASLHLPSKVQSIENIFKLHPNIQNFVKYLNVKRFDKLNFFIISQPQTYPDIQIYGLFVIDKDNIKFNIDHLKQLRVEIKQDFIAYNIKDNSFVYYSGDNNANKNCQGEHQHINCFCKKFGYWPDGELGQYSVYEENGKLFCKDHHYLDENAAHLPREQWIGNEIIIAVNNARKLINHL
jgi:hypothetical protein